MSARSARFSALFLVALVSVAPVVARAATIVINETDIDGTTWGFLNETGTPTGGFEVGPGVPPLGAGSVAYHITGVADGRLLYTTLYNSRRLDTFVALGYYTYQDMTPQAVSFQIGIDYDDSDGNNSFQGRLVYEPYLDGSAVLTSVWQAWNTMAAGGTGNWWGTSAAPIVGGLPTAQLCPQGNPCTWTEVLANWPNARVHTTASGLGFIGLKAGSGWPAGFDGNADALQVATNTPSDDTYNFETTVPVELSQFSVE